MRLSDYKDEQAFELIANLLPPLGRIAANTKNAKAKDAEAKDSGNVAEFAAALLRNNPRDLMEILAVLNGQDPAEFHCTAASLFAAVLDMLNDPELMQLFGLQSKTPASSGSASETTGGQKAPAPSSDTAKPV